MSKKKVFFHYEAKGFDTFTKSIYLREKESSVAEIIQSFTKSYQLEYPDADLGGVEITDASGNVFNSSDDLYSLVSSKDDCFIVPKKARAATNSGGNDNSDSTIETNEDSTRTPRDDLSPKVEAPKKVDENCSELDYNKLISKVEELITQKSYRKARDICLDIISHNGYHNDTRTLDHLCHISHECEKFNDSIRYGGIALAGYGMARGNMNSSDDTALVINYLNILLDMARSHRALGESEEALERNMRGLMLLYKYCKLVSKSSTKIVKLGDLPSTMFTDCYTSPIFVRVIVHNPTIVDVNISSYTSAAKGPQAQVIAQHKALVNLEMDLKADLASRLFLLGRNEEAGAVVNVLIGHPSSVTHVLSLLVYAEVAAACNKIPEAVQGALKAIVLDSTLRRSKTLISKLLSTETGLREVYKQVPPIPQAATAYAFLANVVKDMSNLDTAEALFRQVIRLGPVKDATHFLSLAHLLEGKIDLRGALSTIILGISSQQRRPEYDDSPSGGKEFYPGTTVSAWCNELSELLSTAKKSICATNGSVIPGSKTIPIDVNTNIQGCYVTFVKKDKNPLNTGMFRNGKASSGTQHVDGDFALVLPLPSEDSKDKISGDLESLIQGPEKTEEAYDNNLLDILALAFTAVKLLFLLGRLGSLPPLIKHVEWARRASKQPLHETNIRNEHAYYLCIVQIMSYYTTPVSGFGSESLLVDESNSRALVSPFSHQHVFDSLARGGKDQIASPIYVCGDSHILSSAFAVISPTPGTRKVLLPKLVTGVKQWHLRKESDFFTKEIFRRSMVTVPDGSEVIFCIGEIDCREGILVAVEKGVYKDVQEGMNATITVFRQVLQYLIQKKKLKVYLHPVIPVLDVTRQVVQMFNVLYRAAMKGVKGIHWLDIEGSFVVNNSGKEQTVPGDGGYVLRDEYKLDGTHIHPRYVTLLEAGLRSFSKKGDKKKR